MVDKELVRAMQFADATRIRNALIAGADVNATDDHGMTALHHAAARGARETIRMLVSGGRCNFLLRDKQGRYASDLAIESAQDFAVARLLSRHQMRQAVRLNVNPVEEADD